MMAEWVTEVKWRPMEKQYLVDGDAEEPEVEESPEVVPRNS